MTNAANLEINNLELLVNLGWTENERAEKQMVRAKIEMYFPAPPKACVTDKLDDTVCYADLIGKIFAKVTDKHFHLVEHLSKEIYDLLKSLIDRETKILVHITKHPVIKGFNGDVCFSYGDTM